jgi:hypothetical protein
VVLLICLSATVVGSAIAPPGIAARGQPNPAARITLTRSVSEALPITNQHQRKYLGATTCAGPACHGRPDATDKARSQQTEFTAWSTKDKHHEAYAVLANETSMQMARLLKFDKPPQESDRCLNCHSMNVLDEARRGQDFKLSDGVSCDGCHGPASEWLGTPLNEPYEKSLERGMKDIRNPIIRAEMCLSCHLGNRVEGKTVDHEMYAAGHPPLVFELDAFSHKLPPHWREKSAAEDESSLPRAETWAAGQLVALREAAKLLVEDAKSSPWPEYSHFDCAACHHDLSETSWRQRRPYRMWPGRPLWRGGNAVLPAFGAEHRLAEKGTLTSQFIKVPFGRAKDVSAAAEQFVTRLNDSVQAISGKATSADEARKLAAGLCDTAEIVAWRGPAAAQQLAFALQALLSQAIPADSALARDVEELVKKLSDPHAEYDPAKFSERIQNIKKQVQ